MKKIINSLPAALLVLALFVAAGCTDQFERYNRNPNEVTDEQMQAQNYKTGTNIKNLQSLVVPVQEHLYQFNESLMGGPYAGYWGSTPDAWLAKFETFNPPTNWLKAPFVDVISFSYPSYRNIVNGTDDEVTLALADILLVSIMHRVADNFGPIPYSKIMENASESLSVGYDSQEEAYMKMLEQLDAAIGVLSANATLSDEAFRKFDNVYYGNIVRWTKYANSLKLRMAMRLSYVKPAIARQKAEEAVAAGVMTVNTDNALMHAPENRTALIYNSWADHRIGADIISYMNGYQDPRREKMFTQTMGGSTNPDKLGYYGIRIGIDTHSKAACVAAYSNMVVDEQQPYLWMNAAEITFLRAEGALYGWAMGGTPKDLYEQAITLSFDEKGVSGAAAYAADATLTPAKYTDPLNKHGASAPMSTITIAWEENAGDEVKERNLERIITQKWIAIFPLGMESWAEHRRTGYPRLLPAVSDKSGGTIDLAHGIRRLPYPVEEYAENRENLQTTIATMLGGADNGGTRLWWDVKPYTY